MTENVYSAVHPATETAVLTAKQGNIFTVMAAINVFTAGPNPLATAVRTARLEFMSGKNGKKKNVTVILGKA
jgi:hypothetical protein